MESKKPILISVGCLAIAIGLVISYTNMRTHEMTKDFGEKVNVVVAMTNIPEYGLIREDMLMVVPIYKKFVQPKTIVVDGTSAEAMREAFKEVAGKSAFVNIYENEQITLTKLINQDGRPVLDRQLERNNRAVTIQISPHTGVGRLIRPGNHVDILAAIKYEQNNVFQVEVKTVFQNVLILATGKNLMNGVPNKVNRSVLSNIENNFATTNRKDLYSTNIDVASTGRPDDNYTYVTVQLSATDAEKLLVLQNEIGDSSLYFTLRNGGDLQVANLQTTLLDQVLGPESAYGKSKIKLPPVTPVNPKFMDVQGGRPVPVY